MTVSNMGGGGGGGEEGFLCVMLVHASSKKNVPIEKFNISFESTQNKQQYGT